MIALLALLAAITAPYAPVSYGCNGVTAAFSVTFPYQAQADLVVTSTTAGGVVTTLALTTDYTLSVTSTSTTATLTLVAPATSCPNTNTLKISRAMAYIQQTSFKSQTNFSPPLHELVYDRLEMQIQQLALIQPVGVALGLQNEGSALGNIATLNCVGPGLACTAVTGAGTLTVSTAAPTTVPNSGNTNVEGTADTLARSDHSHALVAGSAFHVFNTGTQTITAGAAAAIISFQTSERDTDSGFNTGTGRYTIPTGKGGDWLFCSTVSVTTGGIAPASVLVSFYKNAGEIRRVFQENTNWQANDNGVGRSGCAVINVAAADIIDVRVSCTTQNISVASAGTFFTYFEGKRIQ